MNNPEACIPQRDSQIMQEQGRLDEALDELARLISMLQCRLSRVLRKEDIRPPTEDSSKPDALVGVARCIMGSRQSVDELRSAVNDMLERLEV